MVIGEKMKKALETKPGKVLIVVIIDRAKGVIEARFDREVVYLTTDEFEKMDEALTRMKKAAQRIRRYQKIEKRYESGELCKPL